MPHITVYSKPGCPYCDAAKSLLKAKGQAFEEIDVAADPSKRDEMIRKTDRMTVPQIFIGETHVGGYDDMKALDEEGKLDPMLYD